MCVLEKCCSLNLFLLISSSWEERIRGWGKWRLVYTDKRTDYGRALHVVMGVIDGRSWMDFLERATGDAWN